MTDNANKLFLANLIELARFTKTTSNKVIKLYDRALIDILATLRGTDLTTYKEERLKTLYAQFLRSLLTVAGEAELLTIEQLDILVETQKSFATKYLKTLVPAIEINTVILSPIFAKNIVENNPTSGLVISRAFNTLSTATANKIDQTIRLGLIKGDTTQQIAKSIKDNTDLTRRNATTLVRTAATDIANKTSEEIYKANGDVTKEYKYIATLDSRTSDICKLLDNKVYEYGKGPVPPQHPNCLTGDSLIPTGTRIASVSKRWFDGDIYIIKTAFGNKISCTPNHPILTDKGWVRAKDINLTSKIIGTTRIKGVLTVDRYDNNTVARIEDIFKSFIGIRGVITREVPLTAPDFHNDVIDSKVSIIGTYSGLTIKKDSSISHHLSEVDFKVTSPDLSSLQSDSLFNKRFITNSTTSDGIISSHSESLPILERGTSHPSELLFTAISKTNPSSFDDSFDNTYTDAEAFVDTSNTYTATVQTDDFICERVSLSQSPITFRQNINTCLNQDSANNFSTNFKLDSKTIGCGTCNIFIDEVVSIDIDSSGHFVYNLETDNHLIITDNLVTHNCRSTIIPVIDYDGLGIAPPTGLKRASANGPVKADLSYGDWLRTQPYSVQEEVLGKKKAALFRNGLPLDKVIHN